MRKRNTQGLPPRMFQSFIEHLRGSKNPYERQAIFFGNVAADGSPILVDRRQLREHAHYLGVTGGGKSSKGLAPLIEQLISFGDSTVILIDLKGDSNELLAAAVQARQHLRRRTGIEMPIRHFTIDHGAATSSFNPFASEAWLRLTPLQRTDVLAAGTNLIYGDDYGRGFFTAANLSIIYAAEQLTSEERTFRSVLKQVSALIHGSAGSQLPSELRRAGVHVYEVINRLAAIDQLNQPPGSASELDFTNCFVNPQILYLKFPATQAQVTASSVGRLLTYFLIASSHGVKNRRQVYLVMDEFQRIASESLAILFEQARSLDISLILSNQSAEDLGKHKSSLLNVIETNCNTRQWFSLGALNEMLQLERSSGLRAQVETTVRYETKLSGENETSRSEKLAWVPRITVDGASYIANDPDLSILKLTGVRHGYSQYRGLPIVVSSRFHITEEEYLRRKRFEWPKLGPGMILAGESAPVSLVGTRPDRRQELAPAFSTTSTEIEFSSWSPDDL